MYPCLASGTVRALGSAAKQNLHRNHSIQKSEADSRTQVATRKAAWLTRLGNIAKPGDLYPQLGRVEGF